MGDASISKISLNGECIWSKTYGNPSGGQYIFSGLDSGDPTLIYDECWGISRCKNDFGLACGTGIEQCQEFNNNLQLRCEYDPRTTWRSYLIHIDLSGNLIWQRANSFIFDEDEEEIPSASSEWVLLTDRGNLVSVFDLSFGIGLEVFE